LICFGTVSSDGCSLVGDCCVGSCDGIACDDCLVCSGCFAVPGLGFDDALASSLVTVPLLKTIFAEITI
jgi:hypothetical protein